MLNAVNRQSAGRTVTTADSKREWRIADLCGTVWNMLFILSLRAAFIYHGCCQCGVQKQVRWYNCSVNALCLLCMLCACRGCVSTVWEVSLR